MVAFAGWEVCAVAIPAASAKRRGAAIALQMTQFLGAVFHHDRFVRCAWVPEAFAAVVDMPREDQTWRIQHRCVLVVPGNIKPALPMLETIPGGVCDERLIALDAFSAVFHRKVTTIAGILASIGLDLRAVREHDGAEPCSGCALPFFFLGGG